MPERSFNAGADKITVNTSALKRPELISEIADYTETRLCSGHRRQAQVQSGGRARDHRDT